MKQKKQTAFFPASAYLRETVAQYASENLTARVHPIAHDPFACEQSTAYSNEIDAELVRYQRENPTPRIALCDTLSEAERKALAPFSAILFLAD